MRGEESSRLSGAKVVVVVDAFVQKAHGWVKHCFDFNEKRSRSIVDISSH
jgi:hypothetical protein